MRRIPELDGLRGIAALTVVGFHLFITVIPFGWAAVDLFFVLSGFLITGIVLDQMDRPGFLRTFYIRRSLRIWPIYYLAFAVLLAVTAVSWRVWLPFALYLQNASFYLSPLEGLKGQVFTPNWPTFNHTWSLAVEEQFYLIWPGLILLAGRRRVRGLAFGCLAGSIAARVAGYPHTLLISRCDGLAMGALLASILNAASVGSTAMRWDAVRPWVRLALATLGVLGCWLLWDWWTGRVRMPLGYRMENPVAEILTVSLIAFIAVAFVVVHSGRRGLAWLRWKPLRDLGTISYGIYLYHALVLHSIDSVLPRSTPGFRAIEGLLTIALTVLVASLSWRFVEQPILRLKGRFDYQATEIKPPPIVRRPSPSWSLAQE